jgi:hypothetical protein
MILTDWQQRLELHFQELRNARSATVGDKPIFALEHGMSPSELSELEDQIRAQIAVSRPSKQHSLPWVIYAAEIGYRYTGDEYWQTFEAETPGWVEHGERDFIRNWFMDFHRRFGGAKPSGRWAEWFKIICWPITHAILPRDLQRQLARILYELRHSFSADLFAAPRALGELIAATSWEATSRFQKLAQETVLVGQIAAALLLEGEFGSEGLLLPATLKRIGSDLDRERSAREWLRGARRLAQERARFRGLSGPRGITPERQAPIDHAREQVAALAIEPALVLRPRDARAETWEVLLEIPDFSHVLLKFPNLREILTTSRCIVAGATGRPLARGRLMHGIQQVVLARWPRPDEVLLQFERSTPELEYLLRAECLLRPGPKWLFRVASDGLAYELRSLRVRPGQRYVVISNGQPIRSSFGVRAVGLACEGVQGALLDLPNAIAQDWSESLKALGLSQAKSIEVWPAGLAASGWDGEGRGEWLDTEKPCLAIRADHAVDFMTVKLLSDAAEQLQMGSAIPGTPAFVELPSLPVGTHKIMVTARERATSEELVGELDLLIRAPRPWTPGLDPRGPLSFRMDPTAATLGQLWEGRLEIEMRGPLGRPVICNVSLFDKDISTPSVSKRLPPLNLPVMPAQWNAYFEKHFRKLREAENAYDTARLCDIEWNADELGMFSIKFEHELMPLRWAFRRRGHGHTLVLLDDSGATESMEVARFPFETPNVRRPINGPPVNRPLEVHASGGMFVAHRGEFSAAIIVPPAVRTFGDLRCNPRIPDRTRSPERVLEILALIFLWSGARLTGNLLSTMRKREVLLALTRHLFFILCGEGWERAEASIGNDEDSLRALKRAVSTKRDEVEFAAALALSIPTLAEASCDERVARLASLVKRFLHFAVSGGTPSRHTDVGAPRKLAPNPDDPDWLCELALRLGSNPAETPAWAGRTFAAGVARLFRAPTVSRAARFLVLAVEQSTGGEDSMTGPLYSGWDWK